MVSVSPINLVPSNNSQEIGQGILLVTEHNAEVNAGFIVAIASGHTPPVDEDQWRLLSASDPPQSALQQEAERLEQLYWAHTRRPVADMKAPECAIWLVSSIHNGLFSVNGRVGKPSCLQQVNGHAMDTLSTCWMIMPGEVLQL